MKGGNMVGASFVPYNLSPPKTTNLNSNSKNEEFNAEISIQNVDTAKVCYNDACKILY